MNLLLVGSSARTALELSYLRALNSISSVSATLFDPDAIESSNLLRRVAARAEGSRYTWRLGAYRSGRRLMALLRRPSVAFDVIIVFKGMQLSPSVIRYCRGLTPQTVWVNVNPDDPFNLDSRSSTNSYVLTSIPLYDLYCIWSRELMKRIEFAGCPRVIHLPFGFDSATHVRPDNFAQPTNERVVFVGSWDRAREATLQTLCALDLRVYGNGWERVAVSSTLRTKIVGASIAGPELAEVTANAAVALNLLRPQNKSAHNMRTFEIPAMGGLMLTTRSNDQARYFPEDEACLMFSDHNELMSHIYHVLGNSVFASRIRRRGHELTVGHSYEDRSRQLLDSIVQLFAGRRR